MTTPGNGASRAVGPGLASFLARLGNELPELLSTPVRNSRNERVGAVVAE